MAHESCESKECAEAIRSIDELENTLDKVQDLHSLVKDPKKFATTFVATKVHDYLIDKDWTGLQAHSIPSMQDTWRNTQTSPLFMPLSRVEQIWRNTSADTIRLATGY